MMTENIDKHLNVSRELLFKKYKEKIEKGSQHYPYDKPKENEDTKKIDFLCQDEVSTYHIWISKKADIAIYYLHNEVKRTVIQIFTKDVQPKSVREKLHNIAKNKEFLANSTPLSVN